MLILSLIPWNRGRRSLVKEDMEDSFTAFRREMNHLFNDFFGKDLLPAFGSVENRLEAFTPSIDVSETENGFRVTAELPGIEEKDIDVALTQNTLTIKGEKKMEREEKDKGFYRMERSYGSFCRTIPFPVDITTENVKATFRKGILTVDVPKSPEAKEKTRKIPIKMEEAK